MNKKIAVCLLCCALAVGLTACVFTDHNSTLNYYKTYHVTCYDNGEKILDLLVTALTRETKNDTFMARNKTTGEEMIFTGSCTLIEISPTPAP
jgi:hypothetical protein